MQMRSILTGLFAAQLVLAGSLFVYNQSQRGGEAAAPLLAFPTADVDKMIVRDNSNTATLVRDGEHWQLAELSQLPASDANITRLLNDLSALQTRWPVASSAAGRERFEVSEEKFQRHLALYKDDTLLGEYYFGTSPGFRQTHVRRADDDEVYALAFNNFDLPADDNDWLKKDLLSASNVTAITGADFSLSLQGESWQLAPQQGVMETALDEDKAKTLATALQNLRVLRVADSVPAGESHTLAVTTTDGGREYVFTKSGTQYFVQRDDREQAFTISSSDYDKLATITRASLLKPLPAPEAAANPEAAQVETQAGSVSLPD